MTWTYIKPTKPGWYFFCPNGIYFVVELRWGRNGELVIAQSTVADGITHFATEVPDGAAWCEIEVPHDPEPVAPTKILCRAVHVDRAKYIMENQFRGYITQGDLNGD
jgi:hypothetical protein